MNKVNVKQLGQYFEQKINEKAKIIIDKDHVHDGAAFGEMQVYFCLRRILNHKATLEDLGVLAALNDCLQKLGVIAPKESVLSKIDK